MERNEWLEKRRAGIGGSEIAALFSRDGRPVHPFLSQLELYQRKVAKSPDRDSLPMSAGRLFEPIVRERLAEQEGWEIGPGVTLEPDAQCPILIANTDGTVEREGELGVYEGKASSRFKRNEWDDGVPAYYAIQCQAYLACTNLPYAVVAMAPYDDPKVLLSVIDWALGEEKSRIPDFEISWWLVDRNEAFIDQMRDVAQRWWAAHVLAGKPPDPDGSKSADRAMKVLYSESKGGVAVIPSGAEPLIDQLDAIRKRKRELEEAERMLKQRIVTMAAGSDFLIDPRSQRAISTKPTHVKESTSTRRAHVKHDLRMVSQKKLEILLAELKR